MSVVFLDTSIVLNEKFKFSDYDKCYLSIVSIEELDNLKTNERIGYQARQAIRNIINSNNVEIKLDYSCTKSVHRFLEHKNDNNILSFFNDVWINNKNCTLLTDDYAMLIKAKALGLPCQLFEDNNKDNIYKGYKELSGNTDFVNDFYTEIKNGNNIYNFLQNEYLILHNTDLKDTHEYRFDGSKFIELRLPPSKAIKGRNSLQRCSLDLLNNRDIPIKIIAGGFGTGKTLEAVKIGLYQTMNRNFYKTLMYIRNPVPVDDTDIGFLPGKKEDKIFDYCRPFLQYINDGKEKYNIDELIKNEKIKMDAVSFLKGVSLEDSFVIMDEAEDLNLKLLKTIGSRIGLTSCVVFTGDWEQSEGKYKYDNGLLKLVQQKKGHPLVGVVVLDEVLRSPVARLFNDLK